MPPLLELNNLSDSNSEPSERGFVKFENSIFSHTVTHKP